MHVRARLRKDASRAATGMRVAAGRRCYVRGPTTQSAPSDVSLSVACACRHLRSRAHIQNGTRRAARRRAALRGARCVPTTPRQAWRKNAATETNITKTKAAIESEKTVGVAAVSA